MNLPLVFKRQHLFIQTAAGLGVFDTGSPVTIGETGFNPLNGNAVKSRSMSDISEFLGVKVVGLIGTDVVNDYDHLIDLRPERMCLEFSETELTCEGYEQSLDFISLEASVNPSIPTLRASVGDQEAAYIFDTGAQLSYRIGQKPEGHVPCTPADDFWPPIGEFNTETYHAQVTLSGFSSSARFGVPPPKLVQTLNDRAVSGIIGNELMIGRLTGYFPRRRILILQS